MFEQDLPRFYRAVSGLGPKESTDAPGGAHASLDHRRSAAKGSAAPQENALCGRATNAEATVLVARQVSRHWRLKSFEGVAQLDCSAGPARWKANQPAEQVWKYPLTRRREQVLLGREETRH